MATAPPWKGGAAGGEGPRRGRWEPRQERSRAVAGLRLPLGRRGHAVGAVVRSSPGDAVDCSSLRLAWAVSAWPPSPRGAGARRDRRSAYWLWTGAAEADAEAGEATEW
ncbi:uncharacterized protein ACIBXB_018740 [Morphnus guianensis]